MITNEQKELVQWAMDYALKNGCRQSRVCLCNGASSSFEVRDMQIDRLQQASENLLVVSFFVDGKYGSFSTNKLDRAELSRAIVENIAATRYLAVDKARTLPDAARYYKGGMPDLQLMDPAFDLLQPERKKELAMQACAEIYGKDPRIISATSAYADEKYYKYLLTSNGFEGESATSCFSLYANASVKDQSDARPEAYWYDTSLFYNDLQTEHIGEQALERALRKLGQSRTHSGKYDMIVDNLNATRLLSPVMDAIDGFAIQQKNSFLLNRLGEQVMGQRFTLRDEPHRIKASGARYFDEEGVATRPMTIFDKGVLNTYFIDTYRANKMNMAPTIASASILTMEQGEKNLEQMIATVRKGIWITGFNGGNCNSATGDFSYGIEGLLIENGEVVRPVSEMNITGNMIHLWNRLVEVGNDPRTTSCWQLPSLHFEGIDFNGL